MGHFHSTSFLLSRWKENGSHASYFLHNLLDFELYIVGQKVESVRFKRSQSRPRWGGFVSSDFVLSPYSSLYKPLVYKAVHSGNKMLRGKLSESKFKYKRAVHETLNEVEIKVRTRGRSGIAWSGIASYQEAGVAPLITCLSFDITLSRALPEHQQFAFSEGKSL